MLQLEKKKTAGIGERQLVLMSGYHWGLNEVNAGQNNPINSCILEIPIQATI